MDFRRGTPSNRYDWPEMYWCIGKAGQTNLAIRCDRQGQWFVTNGLDPAVVKLNGPFATKEATMMLVQMDAI